MRMVSAGRMLWTFSAKCQQLVGVEGDAAGNARCPMSMPGRLFTQRAVHLLQPLLMKRH